MPVGPLYENFLTVHSSLRGAKLLGFGLLSLASALLLYGPPVVLIRCVLLQNALQIVTYLAIFGLDNIMQRAINVQRPVSA